MLFVYNGYERIGLVFYYLSFTSISCIGTEAIQVFMVAEGSSRKRNG